MRTKRPGLFIAALLIISSAGAVYYTGGAGSLTRLLGFGTGTAQLKEKQKQVSDKIHKLAENEGDELDSEARKSSGGADPSTFEVVVGKTATAAAGTVAGSACAPIEYAGSGPDAIRVDAGTWSRFMADYHQAKDELVSWLHRNSEVFPQALLSRMELEIRESRVMRPQAQVEPDLSWRGIAAWTRPRAGTIVEGERPALIQVSDGFLKLYQKDRFRARFELTRVLAQAWSPCELGNGKPLAAWNGMMQCLGFSGEQSGCTAGAMSETAWAASSAVAVLVAPPKCEVPAFSGAKFQACLGGFKRSESVSYEIEQPARKIASKTEGKE